MDTLSRICRQVSCKATQANGHWLENLPSEPWFIHPWCRSPRFRSQATYHDFQEISLAVILARILRTLFGPQRSCFRHALPHPPLPKKKEDGSWCLVVQSSQKKDISEPPNWGSLSFMGFPQKKTPILFWAWCILCLRLKHPWAIVYYYSPGEKFNGDIGDPCLVGSVLYVGTPK